MENLVKTSVFLTASGNVQKVNKTVVAQSDYAVFRNFTRYNRATQTALIAGIAGAIGASGKVGEVGISWDPNQTGYGVWVHIGRGKYVFIEFYPPLPPPKPDPRIIQAKITEALSGTFAFKRTFSNATCCDIIVVRDGKNAMKMIIIEN